MLVYKYVHTYIFTKHTCIICMHVIFNDLYNILCRMTLSQIVYFLRISVCTKCEFGPESEIKIGRLKNEVFYKLNPTLTQYFHPVVCRIRHN